MARVQDAQTTRAGSHAEVEHHVSVSTGYEDAAHENRHAWETRDATQAGSHAEVEHQAGAGTAR
eukprot:4147486-Prymnesium_polylepis.1